MCKTVAPPIELIPLRKDMIIALIKMGAVLFILILLEGLFLILFSQMNTIGLAIITMTVFALFTHMSCGATYALVPFIDRNALGGVAGIIGAGGNVGAVAAGFLLKGLLDVQTCLFILGGLVMVAGCSVILIRFTTEHKEKEQKAKGTSE